MPHGWETFHWDSPGIQGLDNERVFFTSLGYRACLQRGNNTTIPEDLRNDLIMHFSMSITKGNDKECVLAR